MGITVGILAHVDAGKTTLAEQLLYHAGMLHTLGRVDRQTAFLDHDGMERRRGITIFADQASFYYQEELFHLIDTPGHVDFSGEMERSLWVMDCAILVVSSVEGVQSHTETVWRLLQKRKIPTFLFLNKTDRPGAHPDGLIQEIAQKWKVSCLEVTEFSKTGRFSEEQAEQLAELDDTLLEEYLSNGYQPELWAKTAIRLFRQSRLLPAFSGCALAGDTVPDFLHLLYRFAPRPQGKREDPFSAQVYKIRHDSQGGRIVFFKVTQGTLHPRDSLLFRTETGEERSEKVNELRLCQGGRYQPLEAAFPGDLCAVTGLPSLTVGQIAGAHRGEGTTFELIPLLSARVLWDETACPARTMLGYLQTLEREEPLLGVEWQEQLQQIHIHIMGEVQLEVLTEWIRQRYGISVQFGEPEVLYRETIAGPVIGCGHFEPLRHYAEVHLRLSPAARGSGITFSSECPTDALSSHWQNLIQTHVLEREHRGVLTGMPLTDVQITLLSGQAHLKHTEGGDFREAAYRAVRQGLMQAESMVLEPYYRFEIEVEPSLTGRIFSDIQKRSGSCEAPAASGDEVRITGRVPVAEMNGYMQELTAFSRGRGRMSLQFDGYDVCHNAAAVIRQKEYDPLRDVLHTPDSVFCSHGAGFLVKWDEVPSYLHLPLETV